MRSRLPALGRSFASPPISGSLRTPAAHAAGGFTLVSAIFLMVVLVILGVSLVTISSVQHTTAAQQLQTVRANYAARAGMEWAVAQAANAAWCPAPSTSTFALGGALSAFTVSVACRRGIHTLPAGDQTYFVVDVTAQSSGPYGSPDFVLRRAQSKVMGPAPP